MADAVKRQHFRSSDPEEGHAFLVETYADNEMLIRGCPLDFRFSHDSAAREQLSVARLHYGLAVEHRVEPLGQLLLCRVRAGELERETAGQERRFRAGDVFIVAAPDAPYRVSWRDADLELFTVDQAVLTDLAAEQAGGTGRADGPISFTTFEPLSPAAGRRCATAMDVVDATLAPKGEDAPTLVVDTATRLLSATVLSAFGNSAMEQPAPAPAHSVTLAAVRRAQEFIEARADQPIGTREIAEAAHVAPRTLQLAFRRYLDTTPTAYLRHVRLAQVHEVLRSADPTDGTTVIDTAMKWGFTHPSRFAAFYRQRYGCSPRQTLHR